jgi:hypothetical protein
VRANSSRAETFEPLKKGCGVWLSKRSARPGRSGGWFVPAMITSSRETISWITQQSSIAKARLGARVNSTGRLAPTSLRGRELAAKKPLGILEVCGTHRTSNACTASPGNCFSPCTIHRACATATSPPPKPHGMIKAHPKHRIVSVLGLDHCTDSTVILLKGNDHCLEKYHGVQKSISFCRF